MRILITSDIHGHLDALKKLIKINQPYDYHLDAGDICLDQKQYQHNHIITVKGNNDYRSLDPYERILDLNGIKILLTHGHLEHVKFGMDRLKLKAKLHNVDLCIFGHTHQRYLFVEEGITFVNPGSVGDDLSYAIYEKGQIQFMRGIL